jgi:hypothetical protein
MDLIEHDVVEEALDETETPSEEDLADFRAKVSEWMKMDDQIRKLEVAIRERKVHQKALSSGIQKFMDTYGYDNLNTNQGRIRHSVRTVKIPVKLTEVKEKLLEFKHLTGEELFKTIFESDRPTKENKSIRRVIPKISMNLDL